MVIFVAHVGGALLVSSLIELYCSFHENQSALVMLQREKAVSAANTIEHFVREIERGIASTIPPQWAAAVVPADQRLSDYRRLLRQLPAIAEIVHLDRAGREQVRYSQLATNALASQADHSAEPRFVEARGGRTYLSPVYFRNNTPYMTIAIGEDGPEASVTSAEVNLKLIWAVVSHIRVGRGGRAYVAGG
jgi:hypothetical protein